LISDQSIKVKRAELLKWCVGMLQTIFRTIYPLMTNNKQCMQALNDLACQAANLADVLAGAAGDYVFENIWARVESKPKEVLLRRELGQGDFIDAKSGEKVREGQVKSCQPDQAVGWKLCTIRPSLSLQDSDKDRVDELLGSKVLVRIDERFKAY
jgi:hypothetical protein